MSKKIRLLLIILAIPFILITLIQSDFKNFKSSSKRVAEQINSYYSSQIVKDEYYNEKNINEIEDLKKYLIKNNKIYATNIDKFNIYISIGDKETFYQKYNIKFNEALEDKKKLKKSKEKYYLITKNLIRLYDKNDKYLKIVSDNSFILKKIIQNLSIIILICISLIFFTFKISKRYNLKFYQKIINIIKNLKIEFFEVYIFIVFLGLLNLFFPTLSVNYWYVFYFSVLLYLFYLGSNINFFEKYKYKILPLILIAIVFIALYHFINILGYMGKETHSDVINKIILLSTLIPFIFYLLKKSQLNNLSIFLALILSISFIQFRSLSDNVDKISDFIYINILLLTNYYLITKKSNNTYISFLFFLIVTILSFMFAFRTDYIFLEEQGFHISYFIAPIVDQISDTGYKLLSDGPSQYGFLNLVIPSIINYKSGLNSFHIFQSTLLVFTSIIIFITINKSNIKINKIFFYVSFVILLFLSDPYLIGPNPYPSSSVVRFFPVYMMIVLINFYPFDPVKRISKYGIFLFSLFFAITFLWSIEVFFYVIFPIFMYCVYILVSDYSSKNLKNILKNGVLIITTSTILITFFLILYKEYYNLDSIFIDMHYMHVFGYGKGYATVSLTPFSPALILLIPLYILVLSNMMTKDFKKYYYIFLIIGLLSYFFGRAVPNNILALWPIYFLTLGLLTSYTNIKYSNFLLIPIIIIISICQFSIIKRVDKIYFSKLNPSITIEQSKLPIYDINSNDFTENLNNFISKLSKKEKLSVISFGDFNKNLIRNDGNDIFLPSPWLLIASPLPIEKAKRILLNSKKFENSEGYIIYDKKWDYHYSDLIKGIKSIKRCNMVQNDQRFETYFCKTGFIN
tara:strand:- start:10295 stop:12865 length:2571 start_codon:yes stop_codon:yes gene_type:complete